MPAPRCLLAALVAVAVVALAPAVARAAEAEVGATGTPFRGADASGAVRGWVDAHLHITANQRAGGRVLYGEPFDPRGIEAALGDDAPSTARTAAPTSPATCCARACPSARTTPTAGPPSRAGPRSTP